MELDRRTMLIGAAALVASPALASGASRMRAWTFDSLTRVGGRPVRRTGAPRLIDTPYGRAVVFAGDDDALFIDQHPLAGAATFTIEALFRPDGGAAQQRWLHLESIDRADLAPGTGATRMLFEIRVVQDRWYLDAFAGGDGYRTTLAAPDKTFPVGTWYHVGQSFDGSTYRAFVDGVLQAEAVMAFTPQGPGRAAVGMRLNHVNPFRGAIREVRFTPAAIVPTRHI